MFGLFVSLSSAAGENKTLESCLSLPNYQPLHKSTCGAGGRHPLVVVWVHTHAVVLQVEGELTELLVFQLVLMEVWPTPQTGIDHMREALPTCYLQKGGDRDER